MAFPLKGITEKSLLTDDNDYIRQLTNFNNIIKDKIKEIEKQMKPYISFLLPHVSFDFHNNTESKYLIALLNGKLEISEIISTNKPIDLSEKMGIIIMNHSLLDYDVGIEYSAINGFLFKDGEICNTIAQITGYKKTSPFSNPEEERITLCSSTGLSGINDAIEYGEGFDLEDYISYNIEHMYDISIEFEDTYTAIYFENNELYYSAGMELSKIRTPNIYNHVAIKDISPYYSQSLRNKIESSNKEMFEEAIISSNTIYCQDGVELPFNLYDLFPLGYFKIVLNTTADARMPLNVTRHEPSQLRSDIDLWSEKVGVKIQTSLLKEVDNMFNSFHLFADYSKLLSRHTKNTYFALKSKESVQKLIKNNI